MQRSDRSMDLLKRMPWIAIYEAESTRSPSLHFVFEFWFLLVSLFLILAGILYVVHRIFDRIEYEQRYILPK